MRSFSPSAVAVEAAPDTRRVERGDADYPARLADLHDPPPFLYVAGSLAMADSPAVAIVGARRASPYGLRMARAIADALARAGATIVSGLALGVDGASHEAALAVGGRTVAVLGTGIDVAYPPRHHALQARIGREGLLLSEHRAGSTGHGGAFPRRNRIIAALADVTIVVEAGEGSGSLITADVALELGRTVATIPNAIDVPGARGSNALLKQGAEPLLSVDDALSLVQLQATPLAPPALDADAAACWDAVEHGATTLTDIVRLSGLTSRSAAAAVAQLEIEGLLVSDGAALRATVGARAIARA